MTGRERLSFTRCVRYDLWLPLSITILAFSTRVVLCGLLISARAVSRRIVSLELMHNDVDAGGEVNTGD